jgi:hypothetical protein
MELGRSVWKGLRVKEWQVCCNIERVEEERGGEGRRGEERGGQASSEYDIMYDFISIRNSSKQSEVYSMRQSGPVNISLFPFHSTTVSMHSYHANTNKVSISRFWLKSLTEQLTMLWFVCF